MGDIQSWWDNLPVFTKYLFVGSFGLTLAANFGLVSFAYLILDWHAVFTQFQLWRLVTCFLFHGALGFPFLINMLFLVRYAGDLERNVFGGRLSDYLYMVLLSCGLLLIAGYFMKSYILGMGLIMVLIYYWSRKNPDMVMSFLFGFQFKAIYFPWVLVGFNVLMGGFPLIYIMGIMVGHVYFFLEDVHPRVSGKRYLKTPQFMYDIIPPRYNSWAQPQQPQQQPQGGFFGGRGQALGGQ